MSAKLSMFSLFRYHSLRAFLLIAFYPLLNGATLPDNFAEVEVATGLDPVSMTLAPDGRLFIMEKHGAVRIIKDGELLEEPFMTLEVNNENERGLQSLAFDPDFENNGYIYVYYTAATPEVRNTVSLFVENGDTVLPGSETVLLQTEVLTGSGIHNGGALHFRDGLFMLQLATPVAATVLRTWPASLGKFCEYIPMDPFLRTIPLLS